MAFRILLHLQELHNRFPPRTFLWSLARSANVSLGSAYELFGPANMAH